MHLIRTMKAIMNSPLNRDRKARSLVGYLKWQIGSRLIPGSVLFNWVNGARLVVAAGERGLTGNVCAGLHEFYDMSFVLHFLNGSDLFVDVGANAGSYTVLACAAAGARGVCFEPVPETYQRLKVNLAVNELQDRVRALNQGVGDTEGELRFSTDESCMNHVLAEGEFVTNSVAVPVLPLDVALPEPPALIKIDVEGFETMVLKGAQKTLASPQLIALLIELNGSGSRYGFDEGAIPDALSEFGFHPYSYNPWQRKLSPLATKSQSSGNTLFIRNIELAQERVRSAQPFHVQGKKL